MTEVSMPKAVEPKIRGGLIVILIVLILRLALNVGWLTYSLIENQSYLFVFSPSVILKLSTAELEYFAFAILSVLTSVALQGLCLYLFLGKFKSFVMVFTLTILVEMLLEAGSALLTVYLLELPTGSRGAIGGIVFAIGIIQYMFTSPRARATFVN
jgi:hypothetical protein